MLKFKIVEEIGIVQSTEDEIAVVSLPRKSACEGCSMKACRPEEGGMIVEALNPVNARTGQKVRIAMKSYTYLQGSIIAYGIPALGLIVGAVLGKEVLSAYFRNHDPDIIAAVCGFGALVISFIIVKIWSSKANRRAGLKPVIEEILEA
jgi:sigma-E factor negative regulatory protein RseC